MVRAGPLGKINLHDGFWFLAHICAWEKKSALVHSQKCVVSVVRG